MTTPRNLDRLIRTYLQEDQALGPPEVPDHVYGAIRDGIEQTRQRAVIGSMGVPDMNKFLAIGLGTAAVVAVLLIGSNLIGSSSPAPGGEPPASTAPSIEPSTPADGSLPVGAPFIWSNGQDGALPVTVTIPAPGWHGTPGFFAVEKNGGSDPPDAVAVLVFTTRQAWSVPGDACHWESTMPDTPSTTIDELVAALSAQASRDASAPVEIEVDGHAGKSITIHLPSDIAYRADEFPDCDHGSFCQWFDPELGAPTVDTCARTGHFPGQIDELWIVEVNDRLVVIDAAYHEGTPDGLVDEQRAIVDSIIFE